MQLSDPLDWFEDPANLKNVRKQLGLSQIDLARIAIGVTSAWIASAETGRIALVGPKAQALWDALERTFNERVTERTLTPMAAARIRAKANVLFAAGDEAVQKVLQGETDDESQARLETTQRLIDAQTELIEVYSALTEKDAHIGKLEQQVSDLRNLYEVETQLALNHDRARELREKLEGV